MVNELAMEGESLNLFGTKNKFRKFLFSLVTDRRFDYFVILIIIISAVQLAIDTPLRDPESSFKKTLDLIDLCTTLIFIIEAIMKILAFGLVLNGDSSYI